MAQRIVVFGATGFTGDLTARALVDRGARPVLAGRNRERLDALAGELGGVDVATADAAQPDAVRALVEPGDVLVSTVGPFLRHGEPAVDAAIEARAHYLDSTGEGPFIRRVFEEWGPRAAAAGVALLTAFGYDFVPGNLAGALALDRAGPEATRVEIGYFAAGMQASAGTRASAALMMLEPGFAYRGGVLTPARTAAHLRHFSWGGRSHPALSVAGTEHLALPRLHPSLRDVGVYLGWAGDAAPLLQLGSTALGLFGRVDPVRRGIEELASRLATVTSGGPDEATRARASSRIVARAMRDDGRVLSEVELEGPDGYELTAALLAWGAMRAAGGGLSGSGALGPVDGFGLEALIDGAAECGLLPVDRA